MEYFSNYLQALNFHKIYKIRKDNYKCIKYKSYSTMYQEQMSIIRVICRLYTKLVDEYLDYKYNNDYYIGIIYSILPKIAGEVEILYILNRYIKYNNCLMLEVSNDYIFIEQIVNKEMDCSYRIIE